MNCTVVTDTLADVRVLAANRRFWFGLIGVGLVIGLTGPFGTFTSLSVIQRCAYWVFVVVSTFWIGYAISFALTTAMEDRNVAPPYALVLAALVASLPLSTWIGGWHVIIFAETLRAEFLRILPYVAVISVAMSGFAEALEARTDAALAPPPEPASPVWLDHLPTQLGRNLILLQAQDHYVRAETDKGDALIRASLQDATAALGDNGVRVHRSWWVSRNAIQAYGYRKGAPVVILVDGRELPVGRTYRRAVRQAITRQRAPETNTSR